MENQPVLPRRRNRAVTITAVLVAIVILTSLGTWQLNRLAWKEELIETLDSRTGMAAVDFAGLSTPYKEHIWRPVTLGGQWLPATGLALGPRTLQGQVGVFVFAPFRLADNRIIFVNRGWAPSLAAATPAVDGPLTGIVRLPERGRYAPDNSPDDNQWYWPDLAAMGQQMGFDKKTLIDEAYVQLSENDGNTWPQPVPAVPDFRNDHLQYAIFWFGMAGMLLIFFALTQRLRRYGTTPDKENNSR